MLKFSTYEQAFDELLENEGLKKKAAKSGISYGTLKKVYNRGMAAWRTGHRPGTTPQQWGMARVNSYIGKGKGTYYGADSDLSGKGKKKSKKEDVNELSKAALNRYVKAADKDKSKKHVQADIGKISRHAAHVNQIMRNRGITMAKSKMNPVKVKATEALDKKDVKTVKGVIKGLKKAVATHSSQVKTLTKDIKDSTQVKEISKRTAANYIGKASRDAYFKGRDQGTVDAISAVGGSHPHQDYKKSPERKAAMRMRGIDRATKRLTKKEAMSDAEKKAHDAAIAAFKAKGGKIKKLKPGYAQGYHGKADPAAGMKGMMDKGDTRSIGTRKKVGSMK